MRDWTLLDFAYVVVKRKRLVGGVFLFAAILSVIVSLLLPKWYRASATIMPPRKDLGLFGIEQSLPMSSFNLLGFSDETLKYKAILESRVVAEKVIRKFDIMGRYSKKKLDDALKYLSKQTDIQINEENTITVAVLDRKPKIAAAMANEYVRLLDSLLTHFDVEKARNDRIFIGRRLEQNKRDLAQAEEKLKEFSLRYGAIDLPSQTQAEIENAAEVQAKIYATEVELGVKLRYLSPKHDEVKRLRFQLDELKRQLASMKFGPVSSLENRNGTNGVVIPFQHIPDLAMQYARLYREVEVQSKLYQFLMQQYEQARIREAKTTPVVQVLDYAVPPERKAKPKRALIVASATLLATLLAMLVAVSQERIEQTKRSDPERYKRYQEISGLIHFRRGK